MYYILYFINKTKNFTDFTITKKLSKKKLQQLIEDLKQDNIEVLHYVGKNSMKEARNYADNNKFDFESALNSKQSSESEAKNIYEVTGLNYYGYHFGETFEHEYYARKYLEKKKALDTTISLTYKVNDKVVEAYESRGTQLVKVVDDPTAKPIEQKYNVYYEDEVYDNLTPLVKDNLVARFKKNIEADNYKCVITTQNKGKDIYIEAVKKEGA